jgi:Icc-related predicted phosphoesterase
MENYDKIYLVGDLHGDLWSLENFVEDKAEPNSLFVQVGDLGIGFPATPSTCFLKNLNDKLAKKNSRMYAIRGNHDDPEYFNGLVKLSNVFLLKDYTIKEINGLKWFFVGGATSIDRHHPSRIEGLTYWKDEILEYDPTLTQEADVLILHTSPTNFAPVDSESGLRSTIKRFCPPVLPLINKMYDDLTLERELAQNIYNNVKPKFLYYGHFHFSNEEYKYGCRAKLLHINEIVEFTDKIEYKSSLTTY